MSVINLDKKRILLSRTDGLGDVILTLPLAGLLKKMAPTCTIYFLGRTYSQPIIEGCTHIDEFINWDTLSKNENPATLLKSWHIDIIIHVFPRKEIAYLAKQAQIPIRIGTYSRPYHWLSCNYKQWLSRKNSPYHEAQLNLQLALPLGAKQLYTKEEMANFMSFAPTEALSKDMTSFIDTSKKIILLHPKSKGSAREWGVANFAKLISLLPQETYQIAITGTEEEGLQVRDTLCLPFPHVIDLTGKLSLNQLIALINTCHMLVACSTGPLHIAAALNKKTIGLFPPIKPMHAGRWAPIGKEVIILQEKKTCTDCRKKQVCACIQGITPASVLAAIENN